MNAPSSGAWLLSRPLDLLLFGGSTLAALFLLVAGRFSGDLQGAVPPWLFLLAVVGVDVAHVWATGWRLLAGGNEGNRRALLYGAIAGAAYVTGVVMHAISPLLFWHVIAYTAVFHFIRQQYGWVALYRRKNGENEETDGRISRRIDSATIYGATLAPLLFWHTHPRQFSWFVAGDFLSGLPPRLGDVALAAFALIFLVYLWKEASRLRLRRRISWGKNLIVFTTILTWFLGIVVLDSDYAFTVTNVLVHGIPYFGLVYVTSRRKAATRTGEGSPRGSLRFAGVLAFLLPLLLIAFLEEWGWDRAVWHEHPGLFPGPTFQPGPLLLSFLVPLLALPQATHYLLDGFLWRIRPENATTSVALGLERAS